MSYNSKYKGSEVDAALDLAKSALQSVPSEYVTETLLTNKGYATTSAMNTALGGKVDKVNGKQLSTEDFTTTLKQKLESLSNYNDDEIQTAVQSLQTQLNTLVSGNANDAINSFNEIIAFLDGIKDSQDLSSIIASIEQQIASKQDVISDLAAIRAGAAKGATALQSHQDISGKLDKTEAASTYLTKTDASSTYLGKTAKAADSTKADSATKATQDGSGNVITSTYATKTELSSKGTYSKPSGGIPKNDLASAVQTSLGKADTALQSYTEQYKGTVTGVKINSTTKNPSNGVVDLGAVITEHQDISGKQDLISDLSSIREGANKGATSIQPDDIVTNSTAGLMSAADKTKLDEIASGAEANVQSDWNVSDVNADAFIKNKPTKVSKFYNDSNYIVDDFIPDGIYAVTADNQLVDYTKGDGNFKGIALIRGPHKFMIAKNNLGDYTQNLYWGKNLYTKDVAGINNFYKGFGTSYSQDYTTWDQDQSAVISDFNGKANTQAIIKSYKEHGVSMDDQDMCKVLLDFNESSDNQGYNDWYIPSCAQMVLIHLAIDEINQALLYCIGSSIIEVSLWTSTEVNSKYGCMVYANTGSISYSDKTSIAKVRPIRDISYINMRIENKQDKLVSGTNIKTINGNSILGSGDIVIEGGSGSGDSESPIFITHFTVSEFISGYVPFTDEQKAAILEAASQNKIIAIPLSNDEYSKGFTVASYHYYNYVYDDGEDWRLNISIIDGSASYNNQMNRWKQYFSQVNLTVTSFTPYVELIKVDEDGSAYVNTEIDNAIYIVQGECRYLDVIYFGNIGLSIRFFTGEDCTIEMYDVCWPNGIVPTIEPYTYYELSLAWGSGDYINAVLTPFKYVEQ